MHYLTLDTQQALAKRYQQQTGAPCTSQKYKEQQNAVLDKRQICRQMQTDTGGSHLDNAITTADSGPSSGAI